MQGKMRKIAAVPQLQKTKKVAAYARVSSGKDAMLHSLSAQVSYYSKLIQNHNGWEYAGVYSDEAMTGTKESRSGYTEMLKDCRNGKIDMIITKSISRFARNTVSLLTAVRELKLMGIDVYFEEQNIHSMSADGELMLTILASYAQEESLSASENQKWRINKMFKQGLLPLSCNRIYGYKRTADYGFEIIPEEAQTVRRIYDYYLMGYGSLKISKILNSEGILTEKQAKWSANKIRYILSNERYMGDLLLQKTYVTDHLTKQCIKNNGELPKYYVEENHKAIIPRDMFIAVQEEFKRRAEKQYKPKRKKEYPFTAKIKCVVCGKNYRRKTTHSQITWVCSTLDRKGKDACASKQIPEKVLMKAVADLLDEVEFDEESFRSRIDNITASNNNKLLFHFRDGVTKEYIWKDRSRSESWTLEMREKARRKTLERRKA